MGCRLIEGHEVGSPDYPLFLFYDSVSGVAFTPTFGSQEEAEDFETWVLGQDGRDDLRQFSSTELWELVGPWNEQWEAKS